MAHYQIPDYQADVCVAFAQGNVGKAIQLAASDDFNEMKALRTAAHQASRRY